MQFFKKTRPEPVSNPLEPYDDQIAELQRLLKAIKEAPPSAFVVDKKERPNGLRRYFLRLAGKTADIYTNEEAKEAARPGRNIAVASALAANAVGAWLGVTQNAVKTIQTGAFDYTTLGVTVATLSALYVGISMIIDKGFYKAGRERLINDVKHYALQLNQAGATVAQQEDTRAKMNAVIHQSKWMSYETGRLAMAYMGAAMGVIGIMMLAYRTDMESQHILNFNNEQVPLNNEVIATYQAKFDALVSAREEAEKAVNLITDQLGGGHVSLSADQKLEIERIRSQDIAPLADELKDVEAKFYQNAPDLQREQDGIGKTGKVGKGPEFRAMLAEQKAASERIVSLKGQIKGFEDNILRIETDARQAAKEALNFKREGLQAQLEAARSRLSEAQAAENAGRDVTGLAKADSRYVEPGTEMGASDRFRTLTQTVLKSHPLTHLGTVYAGLVLWNFETAFLKNIREEISPQDLREIQHGFMVIERDTTIKTLSAKIAGLEAQKRLALLNQAEANLTPGKATLAIAARTAHERQKTRALQELAAEQEDQSNAIMDALAKQSAVMNNPALTSLTDAQRDEAKALLAAMKSQYLAVANMKVQDAPSNDNGQGGSPVNQAPATPTA